MCFHLQVDCVVCVCLCVCVPQYWDKEGVILWFIITHDSICTKYMKETKHGTCKWSESPPAHKIQASRMYFILNHPAYFIHHGGHGFWFFFLPTQHQVSFSSNSALISLVVYFFTLVTVINSAMGIEPKPFHWETTLKLGANIVKEALFTGVAKLIGWRLRACSQKKETFLEKHSGNRSKLQREDVEVHYLYIYIQSNMKPNTSMDF